MGIPYEGTLGLMAKVPRVHQESRREGKNHGCGLRHGNPKSIQGIEGGNK